MAMASPPSGRPGRARLFQAMMSRCSHWLPSGTKSARNRAAVMAPAKGLSPASVQSLALQGGPMPVPEAERFAREPFGLAALRLRRWDDLAKLVGLKTPDFAYYRPALEAAKQWEGEGSGKRW